MSKTISIIVAMPQELEALLEVFPAKNSEIIGGTTFYHASHQQHSIIIALSGVGKVNAAITTTTLIHKFQPDMIFNIGSAGGLKTSQHVFDLVIPDEIVYHDVDVTGLGCEIGQMYGELPAFPTSKKLHNLFDSLIKNGEISSTCHRGILGSGDQFVTSSQQIAIIEQRFSHQIQCIEMEAGAVAHTATHFNIPFFILRALSDTPCKSDSKIDFLVYVNKAAHTSAQICFKMINSL